MVMQTFIELDMLIIFAFYSFSLSAFVFKILAKNSKNRQNLCFTGQNSCKEMSDNFGVTETFVELDLLIILAFYSFSLSVIAFKIWAKNSKNRQNLHFKGHYSCKESSDNFGVMKTFVELGVLIHSFSKSVIVLEI